MARLTDEERQFRKSGNGLPFSRWWPGLALFIAVGFANLTPHLFTRCVGAPLDGSGRAAALVRSVLALPCSPVLLSGDYRDWLLFIALWIPVPFGIVNWRWAKRNRTYWLREYARREAKRAADREE